MLHKPLILLCFVFTFQTCLLAQELKKDTVPETKLEKKEENKPYSLSQFIHETYMFAKRPTQWEGSDWLKVGIVTAAVFSAMPFDEPIANSTQGRQHYYYSIPIVAGRVYGEWYSIGGVAGVFGIYGLIARDDIYKKISIELLQAGLYSEAATEVLKVAIGRARPYNDKGAFAFQPFRVFDDNYHSMPSGHATASMALSTVMSRHANSTALKILVYVPAGFTLFSRIYQDKHWLSDEILGAAIGYATGNWVVDLHEGKRHRINVTSIYPTTTISFSLNKEPTQK
jgi:membrane-associated phospholipid phosphatase